MPSTLSSLLSCLKISCYDKTMTKSHPTKKQTVKTPSQSTYNYQVGLWASFGATVIAVIFNLYFVNVVLASKAVFLLYTPSQYGGSSTRLLDTPDAALHSAIYVFLSIFATVLVMILAVSKRADWVRLVLLIQFVFSGIFLSTYIGNIVESYFNNTFLSIGSGVVVLVLTVAAAVAFTRGSTSSTSKSGR